VKEITKIHIYLPKTSQKQNYHQRGNRYKKIIHK